MVERCRPAAMGWHSELPGRQGMQPAVSTRQQKPWVQLRIVKSVNRASIHPHKPLGSSSPNKKPCARLNRYKCGDECTTRMRVTSGFSWGRAACTHVECAEEAWSEACLTARWRRPVSCRGWGACPRRGTRGVRIRPSPQPQRRGIVASGYARETRGPR